MYAKVTFFSQLTKEMRTYGGISSSEIGIFFFSLGKKSLSCEFYDVTLPSEKTITTTNKGLPL